MENTETKPVITIHVDLAAVQKLRQYFNEQKFQHMASQAIGAALDGVGAYRGTYGPCVVGSLLSDEDANRWDARTYGSVFEGYTLASCENSVAVTSTHSDARGVRQLLETAQGQHDDKLWDDLGVTISELERLVTS